MLWGTRASANPPSGRSVAGAPFPIPSALARPAFLVGCAVLLALSACDALYMPSQGGPDADLESAVGLFQGEHPVQGVVGEALHEDVTIRVVDGKGRVARDARVEFVPLDGAGTTSPRVIVTDANGVARTRWTLGTAAGEQRLEARLEATGRRLAVLRVEAAPGAPDGVLVQPVAVSLSLGSRVQLDARAIDRFGNALDTTDVEWVSSSPSVASVDEDGWVEALRGGAVVIEAMLSGPQAHHRPGHERGRSVVEVSSDEGRSGGVAILSGDNQTGPIGRTLEEPLEVRVTDSSGSPARQVDVAWSVLDGDGSVTSAVTRTDGQGRAEVQWVLGPTKGEQRVSATAAQHGSVTFQATGTDPLPAGDGTITLSPSSLAFDQVGQSLTLSVEALTANGSPIDPSDLSWVSSNPNVASVDGGTVVATGPGLAWIIAASLCCAPDSVAVTVGGGSASYPNEPPGFTAWLDHDMTTIPGRSGTTVASGTGYFSDYDAGSNYSVVRDETFPGGARDVVRITYREGHRDGSSPGRFFGRDVPSADDATPQSEWYVSLWVKLDGSDWEHPPNELKLWYNGVGNMSRPSRGGGVRLASSGTLAIADSFGWRVTWRETANSVIRVRGVATPRFHVGRWHHIEHYGRISSPGESDGELKVWLDGELVAHVTDVQNQDEDGWTTGFTEFHWAPVFGGSCSADCPKTRDDWMRLGPLYVSGRPQ
jgi:hypothetical protein